MLVKRWSIVRAAPRVAWFDRWHNDLDTALATLPEMEMCPHELYRELCMDTTGADKRTALVTHRGDPVAVIGLRRDGARWALLTTWIVPGSLFPVRNGWLVPALTALDQRVFVAWWRQFAAPPASERFAGLEAVETRRLYCQGDYEAFWKETRLWPDITKARRKCRDLRVAVNQSGAAEWTLVNWARKWAAEGQVEVPDLRDRLLVARYWEPRDRHFVISLLDGDRPAGGAVALVHGGHVIGLAYYREPDYEKLSIGTRLLDAVHQWAASAGYAAVDSGGGHRYKEKWAPVDGTRWQFTVVPRASILSRARAAASRRVRKAVALVLPSKSRG